MPKSRHRKNHKQKVQARKVRLESEKARAQKLQREFIMNLIKEEQSKGMFENTPSLNLPDVDTSTPIIEGPSI